MLKWEYCPKNKNDTGVGMKAAQINKYGDASNIQINDVDMPLIHNDQVLIEVHGASLNPFDTIIREGYMKETLPLQFPLTLGGDFSGLIAEVGSDVTGFAIGDVVYGQANVFAGASGALAEFAAANATQIAHAPEGLDYTSAASLPLVGVSALQALQQHINMQAGQKIFVNGGSGGIGTIAIQIAKYMGAYVATTATGEGIELAKELGADMVIDYDTQDFINFLHDYDAVLDTTGGDDFKMTLGVLRPNGIAVSMTGQVDEAGARERGVTAIGQMTQMTTAMLDTLRGLIEEGVVRAHVDQVFALAAISEAFESRENGSVRGKVVIEIKE